MQNVVGQQNLPSQCYCAPQGTANNAPQYQTVPAPMPQPVMPPAPAAQPLQTTQPQNIQVPASQSGVNIQIFNPSVTPPGGAPPVYNVNAPNYGTGNGNGCYPGDYYMRQMGENSSSGKKTEKREIVQLTDEYIKNLENYLNSQDKEVRSMGAKEVFARLNEDHSRKDDLALNALINKMLQDPCTQVRVLALSALDSRIATGDNTTVSILQQMQNSKTGYGQDAVQATNVLLKMSGKTVEKEFEVNTPQKTGWKTETKTTTEQGTN